MVGGGREAVGGTNGSVKSNNNENNDNNDENGEVTEGGQGSPSMDDPNLSPLDPNLSLLHDAEESLDTDAGLSEVSGGLLSVDMFVDSQCHNEINDSNYHEINHSSSFRNKSGYSEKTENVLLKHYSGKNIHHTNNFEKDKNVRTCHPVECTYVFIFFKIISMVNIFTRIMF